VRSLVPAAGTWGLVRHAEWDMIQVALDPIMDKDPIRSTKYNVIFGVTKEEKALEEAISKVIAEDIWPNCINVKTMANYGMGEKAWFVPPDPNPRTGIDRPADYQSPSADHCF